MQVRTFIAKCESVERLLKENRVAFILSKLFKAKGDVMLHADSLSRIRRFADVYGVPLILDEVQTGMGRTGNILLVASQEIDPSSR